MRQPQQYNKNRSRNRGRRPGGGGGGGNNANRVYDSTGPEVKVRGTAQTVADKYTQLARDALSAGHTVTAESYFQHAEHYLRIIADHQANRQKGQSNDGQRRDDRAKKGHDNGPAPQLVDAASSPQPDVAAAPADSLKDAESKGDDKEPSDGGARASDKQADRQADKQAGRQVKSAETGGADEAEDASWQGHTPEFLARPSVSNGAGRPRKARKSAVRPRRSKIAREADAAGPEAVTEIAPDGRKDDDDLKAV